MKKTYQNPTMKIVRVQPHLMTTASVQMYGKDATGSAMSRDGGNFWDEEEE